MLVLVTYDVNTETKEGRKRLRKIAKICLNYGQRVQNSVFECVVNSAELAVLRNQIEKIMDIELDSLRYYNLGSSYKEKVVHVGAKPSIDIEASVLL